eukprot:scaffold57310_cov48-Phaeocystis_antarctica.AAC.1
MPLALSCTAAALGCITTVLLRRRAATAALLRRRAAAAAAAPVDEKLRVEQVGLRLPGVVRLVKAEPRDKVLHLVRARARVRVRSRARVRVGVRVKVRVGVRAEARAKERTVPRRRRSASSRSTVNVPGAAEPPAGTLGHGTAWGIGGGGSGASCVGGGMAR